MSYRNTVGTRAKLFCEGFHIDVLGPVSPNGYNGHRYILAIVDDYTSYVWVYKMKTKDEVYGLLDTFVKKMINQSSRKIESIYVIKRVRTDGGREIINKALTALCETYGILLQVSNAYCHEENGLPERFFQTLFQKIRAALIGSTLGWRFWSDAAEHVACTYNITLNERYGTSPYERAYGKAPDLSWIQAFGVRCFTFEPEERRDNKKLSPRALECRLLGYATDRLGFKLWQLRIMKILQICLLRSRNSSSYRTKQLLRLTKLTNR